MTNANFESEICNRKFLARNLDDDLSWPWMRGLDVDDLDLERLHFACLIGGQELRIVDEWQGISVTLSAPGAREFWISPIETVSESEDGFERIYQGSQIIAVWPTELASGEEWKGQLNFQVARLR